MYSLGVLTTVLTITSVAPVFLIGFAVLSFFFVQRGALVSFTISCARTLLNRTPVHQDGTRTSSPGFRQQIAPLQSLFRSHQWSGRHPQVCLRPSCWMSVDSGLDSFGASSRFMAYMLQRAETNLGFFYSLWTVNRWLSIRFSLLSTLVIGLTAVILLQTGSPAAVAGFALTFALNISSVRTLSRFAACQLIHYAGYAVPRPALHRFGAEHGCRRASQRGASEP